MKDLDARKIVRELQAAIEAIQNGDSNGCVNAIAKVAKDHGYILIRSK